MFSHPKEKRDRTPGAGVPCNHGNRGPDSHRCSSLAKYQLYMMDFTTAFLHLCIMHFDHILPFALLSLSPLLTPLLLLTAPPCCSHAFLLSRLMFLFVCFFFDPLSYVRVAYRNIGMSLVNSSLGKEKNVPPSLPQYPFTVKILRKDENSQAPHHCVTGRC